MRVGIKTNIKVQRKHSNTSELKRKSKHDFKHQRKEKMENTSKARWEKEKQKLNLILNEIAGKKNDFNQISSNKEKKDVTCAIESKKQAPMKFQGNCSYSFNETSEKTNSSQVKDTSQKKRKRSKDEELGENESSALSEVPNKKNCFYKENSNEREGEHAVNAADYETTSSIKDEENFECSFNEHEDYEPVEIVSEGLHILSETENGESKILYEPNLFSNDEAYSLLHKLSKSTNWNQKNNVIRGVEIPQPRLVAWYGPFPYTYSGSTLEPAEMPDCILTIKRKIERFLKKHNINISFNAVLLNCYRDGKDSVAWHCDDELTMGVCPTIASVSLGTTRRFEMRKKFQYMDEGDEPNKYFLNLTNGSLLIMDGCMQEVWQHRIPKQYSCKFVRINLTFRTVYPLHKISPQVITKGSKQQFKFDKNESYGGDKFSDLRQVLDYNRLTDKNDNYTSLYDTDDHKDHLKTIGLHDADSSTNNSHNIGIKKESTPGQELSVNFDLYSLQELIEYPFKTLDGVNLKDYACSLKRVVKAEVIKKFKEDEYVEYKFLKFLLSLANGNQTDRNQKLIYKKMCWIIKRHYKKIKILQKKRPKSELL